jgi:hypothetical protein
VKVPHAIRVNGLALEQESNTHQVTSAGRLTACEVVILPGFAEWIAEIPDVICPVEPARFVWVEFGILDVGQVDGE